MKAHRKRNQQERNALETAKPQLQSRPFADVQASPIQQHSQEGEYGMGLDRGYRFGEMPLFAPQTPAVQMKAESGMIQREGEEEEMQMKAESGMIQREDEEEEMQMKAESGTIQREAEDEEVE